MFKSPYYRLSKIERLVGSKEDLSASLEVEGACNSVSRAYI